MLERNVVFLITYYIICIYILHKKLSIKRYEVNFEQAKGTHSSLKSSLFFFFVSPEILYQGFLLILILIMYLIKGMIQMEYVRLTRWVDKVCKCSMSTSIWS